MKKILLWTIALLITMCAGAIMAGCGANDEIRLRIDSDTLTTEYVLNENIDDYSNAKIYAVFKDGKEVLLSVSDLTFSTISTNSVGEKVLTVSYTDKDTQKVYTANITITVYTQIVGINIDESTITKKYYVGEEVKGYDDVVINAVYSDNSFKQIKTSDCTFSGISTATEGNKILTVSYTHPSYTTPFSKTITISVVGLSGIRVDESTITKSYFVNDTIQSFENVKVYALFADETEKLVNNSDCTFTGLDTNSDGYKTLTIKYTMPVVFIIKETTIQIAVYAKEDDSWQIAQFAEPDFVTKYKSNISVKNEENKRIEFIDRDEAYVVGDDNPFVFLPKITALDEEYDIHTITQYKSIVKVFELLNNEYTELTGADLTSVVALDTENSTFDFTENAIGRHFKIEVKPYYYTNKPAISFDFDVQNGYNIYDVNELSMLDNTTGNNWTSFKETNNISNATIDAIFLHTNLKITKDNISDVFFWKSTEELPATEGQYGVPTVGSLKDYSTVYRRSVEENKTFTFNGNYFMIDASEFPLIACYLDGNALTDNQTDQVTHAALFFFEGAGKMVLKNTNFFGNAERSENTAKFGGLILLKDSVISMDITNVIARAFGITFFSEYGAVMKMTNCKAFDGFSSILFAFSKTTNEIINCEFKDCGGPLMILSHEKDDEASTNKYGTVIADETSILESFVSGQEAWFINMGASAIATQIQQLDASLKYASSYFMQPTGTKKSFIKVENDINLFNVICVCMNSSGPLSSVPNPVAGSFLIDNEDEVVPESEGLDMLSDSYKQLFNATGGQAPIFQCNGKQLYTDGTNLYTTNGNNITSESNPAILDVVEFFKGNYLGISTPIQGTTHTGLLLGYYTTFEAP